jgi:hypothetical protein
MSVKTRVDALRGMAKAFYLRVASAVAQWALLRTLAAGKVHDRTRSITRCSEGTYGRWNLKLVASEHASQRFAIKSAVDGPWSA